MVLSICKTIGIMTVVYVGSWMDKAGRRGAMKKVLCISLRYSSRSPSMLIVYERGAGANRCNPTVWHAHTRDWRVITYTDKMESQRRFHVPPRSYKSRTFAGDGSAVPPPFFKTGTYHV